jgi:hypothetical protein
MKMNRPDGVWILDYIAYDSDDDNLGTRLRLQGRAHSYER